jgi:hypothetical protein
MSTKTRQVIWGGRIMGAKMRAAKARKEAAKAARAADRAEAEAWSVRMEGYGGPAQPSPSIGQCINGGYGWLEIECCRCKTRASLPLDAHPPITRHSDLETGILVPLPVLRDASLQAACSNDQADGAAGDYAVQMGSP